MKDDLIDFGNDDNALTSRPTLKSVGSTGPMARSRLKSKRESVPSMVFNGLKRKMSTKVSC